MATAQKSRFLRRLTRGMAAETLGELTDRQLLERLAAAQDEAVFEALVRRHGPMVYRVCWRVLQQAEDTEDAFQAAFLLLARKLQTVRKRDSLASWLHGVAHRVALEAKAQAARRRRHEARAGANSHPGPPEEITWRELRTVLDAELGRLPEKWRLPLILCYLEGQSQEEAARQLGWSKSTLLRRLEEARAALGRRLTGRGVVWPAALSAVLLSACVAPAALAPGLVSSTVEAAAQVAAGQAAAGIISAKVVALTEGVSKTMFTSNLKIATAALVLVTALAVGAGGLLYQTQAAEPQPPAKAERPAAGAGGKPQAAVKRTGPGTLLLVRKTDFVALNPDAKEENQWPNPGKTGYKLQGRLSPDGARAAFVFIPSEGRKPGDPNDGWPFKVVIRHLGTKEEKAVDFTGRGLWLGCWRPDGKRLVVSHWLDDGQTKQVLIDPDSGKTEPLELPEGVRVLDWAREGNTFLVSYFKDKKLWLGMLEKGHKEARALTELKSRRPDLHLDARLSPDGKRVLFTDGNPEQKDAYKVGRSSQPYLLDVLTRKRQPLADFPDNAEAQSVAWSPDGMRVAYTWWQLHTDLLKKWDMLDDNDKARPTEAFLVVADADGKNAKTIASERTNGTNELIWEPIFGSIDWR
ncbi:MAG: sigma-70 family RNA polymerase sigma factor [Gemmataceae bacterium]|nr:sigma-70 family RNA polymerase sigma factor [Gemmataceae bacterium]